MKLNYGNLDDAKKSQQSLLEHVLGDDHALDLIRSLANLGVPALTSTPSTEPVVVRRFVQHVLVIIGHFPQLSG